MRQSGFLARLALWVICTAAVRAGAPASAGEAGLRPLITTAELVVGKNRFAFGLLKDDRLLEGADVRVRLFTLNGNQAQVVSVSNAPYRWVNAALAKETVHRHADGSRHVHAADNSVRGLYVTDLAFDRAGRWGIEIALSSSDSSDDLARLTLEVRERSSSPALGAPAPRSRNLIAADVKDLRRISSSTQPDIRLHRTRIAEAIAQGKPQLIVFATPQFCTSRMCGPVVDIVRGLLPRYQDHFVFIHQEIWQDFATKKAFATVDEWGLESEPWIFIVDGQGYVQAKFEGLVTRAELEAALQRLTVRRR